MSFDNVCKLLAEKYPTDFVRWLTAEESSRDTRQNTASYTEILAGLRFEDIMQESAIYQDILQKGEQKGASKFLIRQLNRRFGTIDPAIIERLRVLSTEQLETLGEDFLSFSDVANLVDWLDRHSDN
jgi:predicted transposase YdaD